MGGNDWSPLSRLGRPKVDIEREPALQRAFEEFNLNPNDPEDWKECCVRLARRCFSPRGAGQPKKWDDDARLILIRDYIEAMGMLKKGNTDYFQIMRTHKEFGGRYKHLNDASIKTRVYDALREEADRGGHIKLLARAHRARTKRTRDKLIKQLRARRLNLSND